MTTFKSFIASKALEDRLPFPIDFDLLSVESDVKVKVGRFELASIEELTVLEAWFFELLQEHEAVKNREFSLLLNRLSEALITHMKLDCDRQEAAMLVAFGKDEWANDSKYLKYCTKHAVDLEQFQILYAQKQSSYMVDMMLVTLAMILRYDNNWTVGRTATLGRKSLKDIKDFLIREANGSTSTAPEEESEGESTEKASVKN